MGDVELTETSNQVNAIVGDRFNITCGALTMYYDGGRISNVPTGKFRFY